MYSAYQFIGLVFSLLLVISCQPKSVAVSLVSAPDKLEAEIAEIFKDPNTANANWGVLIENLQTRQIVFELNRHKIFVPASNMKLYTTAAALATLGPDFKFKTNVYQQFNNDILIKAQGDPTISGRFRNGDRLAIFRAWADSLKGRGISRITGRLIVDNSYFTDQSLGDGWNWDDETWWYSAGTSAATYNDNCIDFDYAAADSTGEPIRIKSEPGLQNIEVINRAVTSAPGSANTLEIERLRGRNIIVFSGQLPLGEEGSESITVEYPGEFFAATLKKVLIEAGLAAENLPVIVSAEPVKADSKPLFSHYSEPLSEIISVINKVSHNLYAEQVLKTLGAIEKQEGSYSQGAGFVREFINGIGVSPQEFVNVDGSGLSRMNFISPQATATLLRYMYFHRHSQSYLASLPIAGVDGTLSNRMKNGPAAGNVRAKTGSVRHMRSLAGYVTDRDGNMYLFVMMANNYTVPTPYINNMQDRVCLLLADYSAK